VIPLYEAIRSRNPRGLPYGEAVQFFLWAFCTTGFLPENLRSDPIGKEQLIEVFEALTADGLILQPRVTGDGLSHKSTTVVSWADLVGEFLSERIQLDEGFLERAQKYI